jgi:hypothetical protein
VQNGDQKNYPNWVWSGTFAGSGKLIPMDWHRGKLMVQMLALDANNLYVHLILEILRSEKITPSGVGEHFGRFYNGYQMALVTEATFGCSGSYVDTDGNVYATDGNNNRN